MQAKIQQLSERINSLKDILGEMSFEDTSKKQGSLSIFKEKVKNISDIIIKLQKEISENDSITLKEVHKKFEELNPLLNVEKLTSEFNINEDEMYALIIVNFDEIESFLLNLKYIKDNQKILEYEPIIDIDEKKNILREKEINSIDLFTKVYQTHESVDKLCSTYYESVSNLNEKFDLYTKILDALEVLNK